MNAWLIGAAGLAAQVASAGRVEGCIATALAVTGLLVLVSNRGRHPGWLAYKARYGVGHKIGPGPGFRLTQAEAVDGCDNKPALCFECHCRAPAMARSQRR